MILNSWRFERALSHRMFEDLWKGKISLRDLGTRIVPDPYVPDSWWDRLALHIGHAPLRTQHAAFLRESTDNMEEWKQPWDPVTKSDFLGRMCPECGDQWYKNYVVGDRRFYFQPWMQALLRCASLPGDGRRTVSFGQRHSGLKNLEELKPDYVQEIPQDPYGKGPLRMVRKEDGIIIYSVWKDGVDNGGNLDRLYTNKDGTDFGFQLWDVEQRKPIKRPANKEN